VKILERIKSDVLLLLKTQTHVANNDHYHNPASSSSSSSPYASSSASASAAGAPCLRGCMLRAAYVQPGRKWALTASYVNGDLYVKAALNIGFRKKENDEKYDSPNSKLQTPR
jgi:hypothetical protein